MRAHVWRDTGKSRHSHADVGPALRVFYVRCVHCFQTGFFRANRSRIVYTWASRCEPTREACE
jgi:hypothetical protein